ncbi:vWA domain-containing protein [Cohnella thermotolerans]|uniref:vWA domain-containing protein n=1 Tax=Cohnella thermotolerans TaxID=329858 RepID=UPI000425EF65|nr:VWA domain-containing protein [Cohnella thermotolerans]
MHDSVLNTDAFDLRRFGQLFEISEKMQQLERKGKETFPSFRPLMGDVWAGLFKMKPELLTEVDPALEMNRQLMERVMSEKGFQEFREFTRLDDLASALGTVKYTEAVLEWIDEQAKQNQSFRQALQQVMSVEGDAMQQAAKALAKALEQNGQALAKSLSRAAKDAIQTKDNLKSLLGGIEAGSGDAELKKIPLRDQLALAEKLSAEPKLKEIAQWAGRLKLIARKKQRSKHRESIDRNGISMGNQVEKLLPSELAAFASPITKQDFLRRFAEGQTLQYDTKGKEQLGKGPIILCLDQSGSMSNQDTISKGFVLALMSIARKQRRDFALILFSNKALTPQIYRKGRITINDMVQLAAQFLDGGTNFERPLNNAATVIVQSKFNRADVIFLTDGESTVSDSFVENWNALKLKKDFRVLTLLLGTAKEYTVKQFSDRVVKAKNLLDHAAYQAFEI